MCIEMDVWCVCEMYEVEMLFVIDVGVGIVFDDFVCVVIVWEDVIVFVELLLLVWLVFWWEFFVLLVMVMKCLFRDCLMMVID